EPQADGNVSETESNCSAVSGLQTPLFVRVTRRRQIVVPYQPDSPDKKRHDKTAFLNKLGSILDEDDVSEAESCSSTVSGVQIPNVTRTTRSRQSKKKLQPDRVCEVQSEDVSDAESCCLSYPTKSSVTAKRITRTMQMKLQAENTKQAGKGNIKLVSDTEDASSVTEDSKEPNSIKSKCSKFANTTWSGDVKEEVLNDVTPSSLTKMKLSDPELPGKKAIKNTQSVVVDDSEGACGQIKEEYSKILARVGKLEHMAVSLTDCMSSKQFLESQGQITPNESEKIPECKRADAEPDAEQSFTHADKLRKDEQASAGSSPQKDTTVAQRTDSVGRCRVLEISVDSGGDQTGEYAESVSHSSERSSSGNNSITLFLDKDESDESENSDVVDIGTAEENLCYKEADERTPSLSKSLENSSLPAEGLFVIDTEPGMSSSQKYYLDQVDQGSDAESKHEGSEKGEESSDLEEAEDELIDEDEKDEDDDLLKSKTDM
ncbi:TDIF2 protein, partial [Ciccaba nigrolineata]|nr:TDIF2 protein [Ciccaba nigrolineata]